MKTFALIVWFALGIYAVDAQQADADGKRRIARFVAAAPAAGTYLPWPGPTNEMWYAGEIITITNGSFHYTRFTDVVDAKEPDCSGPLVLYRDHICLNHPDVTNPYRVAGTADGQPVLLTKEGYDQWEKTGKVFELNILYLQGKRKPALHGQ